MKLAVGGEEGLFTDVLGASSTRLGRLGILDRRRVGHMAFISSPFPFVGIRGIMRSMGIVAMGIMDIAGILLAPG